MGLVTSWSSDLLIIPVMLHLGPCKCPEYVIFTWNNGSALLALELNGAFLNVQLYSKLSKTNFRVRVRYFGVLLFQMQDGKKFVTVQYIVVKLARPVH